MTNNELILILKTRFENNTKFHKDIIWEDVEKRFTDELLDSLKYMEETGGEPDVIRYNESNDQFVYCDTSIESPLGRRSLCYDEEALNSRKANKPISSAIKEAGKNNLKLLNEDEYNYLQTLGDFDLKSTSWLLTPDEIRNLGGAIFGDNKYNRVFVYHNGAESYYSNRGFRALLNI